MTNSKILCLQLQEKVLVSSKKPSVFVKIIIKCYKNSEKMVLLEKRILR